MEKILTLPLWIQYQGEWDCNTKFINYEVEGVVINTGICFNNFIKVIATHLKVNTSVNSFDIRYKIDENSKPMLIQNDMGLQVYIELKKGNQNIKDYPLCVNWKPMDIHSLLPIDVYGERFQNKDNSGINNIRIVSMLDNIDFDDREASVLRGREIIDNISGITPAKGQLYKNKELLLTTIKNYAIQQKFQFLVDRSSASRYTLVCISEQCDWIFRCSAIHKSKIFEIRKFNDIHTCSTYDRLATQRIATSKVLAVAIAENYEDPKAVYTARHIQRDMRKLYGLDLSYWKAHRAKRKALEMLRGDPSESYARLPSYLYMLKHTNPGSVVSLHKTDEGHFLYVFAALNSSIQGWKYCRPVVVVDGSFLKACYRGTFLTASCQDAAGHILPIAYAIVDSENNASWEWFFNRLKEAIGERDKMCFVSDRNKSIIRAISYVYPGVPHCACMWHLWNNIKDNFRRNQLVLEDIFYAMARAYTVQEFDYYMEEVERIDKRVKTYLLDLGYEKWARAHSAVNRTMIMTSNVAESLNSATKSARELPVMKMFDEMRKLVEKWSYANMKEAQGKLTALTKKYEDILAKNLSEGQHMTVRPSTDYLRTVISMGRTFIVDIRERTCTCRRFQLDELPCAHALAVLSSKGLHGEDYSSLYYTVGYMKKTYEIPVNPMPDDASWEVPFHVLNEEVLHPERNKIPGRPPMKRKQKYWQKEEKLFKSSCGRCGNEGHNVRTCRNMPK